MDRKADLGKRRNGILLILLAMFCITGGVVPKNTAAAAWLELESGSVRVGRQIAFLGDVEEYSFASSNTQIAYVTKEGVVTGKKPGNVVVTASKDGRNQTFRLTVKANGNNPAIKVCLDEISFGDSGIAAQDGKNSVFFTLQNHSVSGVIKKAKCSFHCVAVCENKDGPEKPIEEPRQVTETIEKTITVDFGRISPGEEKEAYYTGFTGLAELENITLQSIVLYSGEAKIKYDVSKDTISYGWGTKDTTPPVIRGVDGGRSSNGNDMYFVVYEDKKSWCKKYISAYDDRDGKVAAKISFAGVDWKKKGTYTITVTAKDKAGNQAKKKMKIQVRCLAGIDLYADRILKRITGSSWSDKAKCKAIYRYVQSHMRYVNYNGGNGWESAALRGLRYGNGNCYAYYGLSRLLLTRAGIPNIMVTRYPAVPNHHHWWNLAYVQGGWYHFDTTPRRLKGNFCLLTDAQLQVYERRSPGTYRYARGAYPGRASKVICAGPF